jgi:hypothetical protein
VRRRVGSVAPLCLAVVVVAVLSACGSTTTPPAEVQPLQTVPDSYHLARPAPGHQQHLATGLIRRDGGLVESGSKQVRCRDCHALEDAGFSAPTDAVCRTCHEDQQRQHHPFDAGASTLGCLTCHPFMAKTLPARFEPWTCFECHDKAQGDLAPITVHRARCEACHRPHEAPFTKAADCSTCHEVSLTHGAKGPTLADTCMKCHPHHTEASVASGQCVTCHTKPTMTAAARVAPEALFPKGHPGCGACHEAHRFEKGAVKGCETCHRGQPVVAVWMHEACTDCHRPHAPKSQAIGCTDGCHRDEVVKHPKSVEGQACTGCHEAHAPGDRLAKPCVACHDTAPFTARVVHGERVTCDDCHAPHDAKPRSDAECRGCHQARFAEVALVTVTPGAKLKGHQDCGACHATLPHGAPGATPKPCLECHAARAPPQKGHDGCESCHESHSGAVVKTCTACHAPAKLPALHAEKDHQRCEACHTPHTPEPGAGPATCRSCHQRLDQKNHPTPPAQCTGCHLFKAVAPGASPPGR